MGVVCGGGEVGALGRGGNREEKKGDKTGREVLNFKMNRLDGKSANLADYSGKVVLMVNVASECGYTPQYELLEALHEKYGEKGLALLGFAANEFGKQEPGTDTEIASFCQRRSGRNVHRARQ